MHSGQEDVTVVGMSNIGFPENLSCSLPSGSTLIRCEYLLER